MIKSKTEYTTLSSSDLSILCSQVNILLTQGWTVQGGIAALSNAKTVPGGSVLYDLNGSVIYEKEYTQALIRVELPLDELVSEQMYSPQKDAFVQPG